MALRCDLVKAMLADGQDRKHTLASNWDRFVPCLDLAGNFGLNAELTIPQSPVMGANVAHRVES